MPFSGRSGQGLLDDVASSNRCHAGECCRQISHAQKAYRPSMGERSANFDGSLGGTGCRFGLPVCRRQRRFVRRKPPIADATQVGEYANLGYPCSLWDEQCLARFPRSSLRPIPSPCGAKDGDFSPRRSESGLAKRRRGIPAAAPRLIRGAGARNAGEGSDCFGRSTCRTR